MSAIVPLSSPSYSDCVEPTEWGDLPTPVSRLLRVFHDTFFRSYNTVLIPKGLEPLYTPAQNGSPAKIVFSHDYFASALHEVHATL